MIYKRIYFRALTIDLKNEKYIFYDQVSESQVKYINFQLPFMAIYQLKYSH